MNPKLIAHRGGAAEAPENTLAAFRHSLSLGLRWVELDVQMSRDGALVVIHDQTVNRTTNGSGEIGALLFEELRRLDAGYRFGPKYRGEKIPTLREVLDLCASHSAGVLIELKSPHLYPGIEQKVASLLGEMWLQGAHDFWCISFDHAAIDRLGALDSSLPLGYLFRSDTAEFASASDRIQAVLPHFSTVLAYPEQVERAHHLGKQVFIWTVNTAEDIRRVAQLGVDGIVSDQPSLLLSL